MILAVILVVSIKLIIIGYNVDWTGFNGSTKSGKTLWDWMQLLIIPLALAIITLFFNRTERKNEQRIASDNQQEAALQEYIKEMSELLLHEKLRESQPSDEVRNIARVRTLTVLPRLDGERKRSILQFLYESGLLNRDDYIIDLDGGDLTKVNLRFATLRKVNLSKANMDQAEMAYISLTDSALCVTTFRNADLFTKDEELNEAQSLKGATMPGGSIHP